jgi:hypothetical protein
MRLLIAFVLQFAITSALFAAPPLSDVGKGKDSRPKRIKVSEDQQKEIDAFEERLAKCIEEKTVPTRDKCMKKFPMPQKRKVKASLTPRNAPQRPSKEAMNCIKIMYNDVAYKCINSHTRMLNAKTYDAWRLRRKRDLDKIEASHTGDKLFRESLGSGDWNSSL